MDRRARLTLLIVLAAAVLLAACSSDGQARPEPAQAPDDDPQIEAPEDASSPRDADAQEPRVGVLRESTVELPFGDPMDGTPEVEMSAPESPAPGPLPWVLSAAVTVYAGPALDWGVRGDLAAGSAVTIAAVNRSAPGWMRVETAALSGWVPDSEPGVAAAPIDGVPAVVLPRVTARAAGPQTPFYPAPSDEREPLHLLAAGEELHVAGRSPDGRWLVARPTRNPESCGRCHLGGWARVADLDLDFAFPVLELPVLADLGFVWLLPSGRFAEAGEAGAPPSSIVGVAGRWEWLPGTSRPTEPPALLYPAPDGLRRFSVDGESAVVGPPMPDFVLAPAGDQVIGVTAARTREDRLVGFELTHVTLSGEASVVGDWAPGCCHGVSLADRGAWSPDGTVFAFSDLARDAQGEPTAADLSDGAEIQIIARGSRERTVFPGGQGVWGQPAWGPDGMLYFVDAGTLRRVTPAGDPASLATPTQAVGFALNPGGGLIAIETADEQIAVVDTEGRTVAPIGEARIFFGSWSPDGRRYALAAPGAPLRVWDRESGELRTYDDLRISPRGGLRGWSPDSATLALLNDQDRSIRLLDVATGASLALPEQPDFTVLRWAPDGRHIAMLVATRAVHGRAEDGLNELAGGQWRIYTRDGALRAVIRTRLCGSDAAWSPDGQWLAVGDQFADCT